MATTPYIAAMIKAIPEIPHNSIFGHLKAYVQDPLAFLQKQQKIHGDIFSFRVARRRLIFINHPDSIRRVLQENHRNYKKSEAYRKLALLLGDGLFTSDGSYWLSQRRTIQPAFHRNQIMSYAETMNDFALKMVADWQDRKSICLTEEMTRVTLRIISKSILNIELDSKMNAVQQHLPFALRFMINRITSPLATPLWIPTRDNIKFKRSLKTLDSLIHSIIQHKKQNLGIDLLSQLITLRDEKTGEAMSDLQLRDELMTLFLAGHETTAMGITWVLNHILRNEPLKTALIREIRDIKHPWEATGNYFIQNVISEALRLYAPVWILSREAIDHDLLGEYRIAPGDRIIFSPYMVHRHAGFWADPLVFDPARFDSAPAHKFAYFPFGGGPRVCIGEHFALMEMTILLTTILKHYPYMALQSLEPVAYDYSITLRPDRDIVVSLT
ncbi:MAG: cytochrome P450 [Cyclobacteriaceae bacterium]|nr:cytochrome P450 [Cyclobacteriaceae bacterium]